MKFPKIGDQEAANFFIIAEDNANRGITKNWGIIHSGELIKKSKRGILDLQIGNFECAPLNKY